MATLKRRAPDDLAASTISSKTFVRTTRSGRVQKIVREVYLRQDIPCSSQLCRACLETAPRDAAGKTAPFILSDRPAGTLAFPQGHYLVPDTNAFLTGMDLFEHKAAFYDVIVLQVVLEEVRNRSLPLYNRLLGLTQSDDKRFHVFFNEFRLETHVVRHPGESINDRNDRAVRRATQWYGEHLSAAAGQSKNRKGGGGGGGGGGPPVMVMISNDRANLAKARQEGLAASSLAEYVRGLPESDLLLDMIPESQDQDDELIETKKKDGARKQQQQQQQRHLYPDYLSMSRLMTGVKSGLLHQGPFNVSPYNYLEGSVRVPAFPKPLLVLGRESINRAVDGDVVVVEVLPREQWKRPSTKLIEEVALTQNESAEAGGEGDGEGEGDLEDATAAGTGGRGGGRGRQAADLVSARERRALQEDVRRTQKKKLATEGDEKEKEELVEPTARIVGVVKRNWRQLVGHVDQTSVSRTATGGSTGGRKLETVFVLPMDRRLPKIRLRTRQAAELLGKRILVAMDAWDRDARHPSGHLIRALGALETKAAETEALLLEFDVQYRPFPRTVLDCLPPEGHDWRVPPRPTSDDAAVSATAASGWEGREDLRDLLVCSIDPIGCQDIDDALHARRLPNGNWEVGVHIADVSHFVRPGNAMDTEASIRGTTVYLVDKRIDMLPMLLGTDLCSLKPYVERFAFSVLWEMTDCPDSDEKDERDGKDGNAAPRSGADIVSVRFTKSVIRSREAFSYEEAQLRIDDAAQQDPLTQGMRALLRFSRRLKQLRLDAGALSLSSPEVKVRFGAGAGGAGGGGEGEGADESELADPVDVETKALLATNSLVEEFMLLANTAVAARIYEAFPQTAMLRRHATPPATNFDELHRQLHVTSGGRLGLSYDSSRALAASLDACVDPAEPYFNTLVRILATRCMTAAEYFPAGTQAYSEFRHYGLATPIYTHFTSPIRRYADLVVHRQLAAAIGYDHDLSGLGRATRGRLAAVCRNINTRHRNAQLAGRASIAYYVGQAVRGADTTADGFVIRVFSNGFVVLVPRFGIESPIRLRDLANPDLSSASSSIPEPPADFDPDTYTLRTSMATPTGSRPIAIRLFQKVTVRITDHKDETTGKRSARMSLVQA